jgi:hypothetical protein
MIRGATMQSEAMRRSGAIVVNAERLEVDDQTTVAALLPGQLGYPDAALRWRSIKPFYRDPAGRQLFSTAHKSRW